MGSSQLLLSSMEKEFLDSMPDDADEAPWKLAAAYCHSLHVEKNASKHTIRNYSIDLKDYLRWTVRNNVDSLHPSHRDLRLYLADLDAAQYARKTINRRLSAIKGFFQWLVIVGELETSPVDVLHGIREDKSLPHRIKPEDMHKILCVWGSVDCEGNPRIQDRVDLRNQAILELFYACGARITEVSDLRACDVSFSERLIKVFGKGSKERIIPIHDLALDSLRKYRDASRESFLKGKGDSEFFFVSTRGNQMGTDAIRKMFKDTLRKAGVNESYSPHDIRHTFASDLLEGGADLRSVQEMLGHASLSTTQIYTHLTPDRLKSVHKISHPRG